MTTAIEDPVHAVGKLLVDEETGRVLRADDQLVVSRRYCETHSFIRIVDGPRIDTIFAGPDAGRRARARRSNEGEEGLDAVEFSLLREIGGTLHLQKVEDEA